jgi:Na+-transporting NADH:ubiquinone oxidoreductase subunit B
VPDDHRAGWLMGRLRTFLDRVAPRFSKGGRYEKFGALFEMMDTLLYTPKDVTRMSPHVRDAIDLKRVMSFVILAALPCMLMAMWNTGYQANLALAELGRDSASGWRSFFLDSVGYDPGSVFACMMHGLFCFLPIYIVTLVIGGIWEVLFAIVRNHEVNEGFFVTSMLYALVLPPDIPLWQVAVGISFGVVIGKEVFGGTGKNILNPALLGRAFLYFAYPAEISGDAVWVAVDGFTGATALSIGAESGVTGIEAAGTNWMQAFLGVMPGSLGETSTLACLIGAAFLILTGIASWRIILGVFAGMVVTAFLFNAIATPADPLFAMPWYWHLVLGGFAFGMVFMATDPVSAAQTDAGRWIFGILIGALTVLIRVANPAFPEAIMISILFANIFAPIIDQGVIWANIRRRRKRRA